ncbi:MAG: hypothetical protein AAF215_19760 [Cyanobacteria bacterium P01_A01_bin.123]
MQTSPSAAPPDPRQASYMALIDRLLACDNGEEPNILNAEPDLLDAGFVNTLMQVASYFAHNDNPDAAKFLIFIARELAHQLGLSPQSQPQ